MRRVVNRVLPHRLYRGLFGCHFMSDGQKIICRIYPGLPCSSINYCGFKSKYLAPVIYVYYHNPALSLL